MEKSGLADQHWDENYLNKKFIESKTSSAMERFFVVRTYWHYP
jgi:hypothetical protein